MAKNTGMNKRDWMDYSEWLEFDQIPALEHRLEQLTAQAERYRAALELIIKNCGTGSEGAFIAKNALKENI